MMLSLCGSDRMLIWVCVQIYLQKQQKRANEITISALVISFTIHVISVNPPTTTRIHNILCMIFRVGGYIVLERIS